MLKLIDYLKDFKYLKRTTDQQPAVIGHVNYVIENINDIFKPVELVTVNEVANVFTIDNSKGEIFKLVASSTGSKTVNIINSTVGTLIIHYKKFMNLELIIEYF